MNCISDRKIFSLGQMVITPAAREQLNPEDVTLGLTRHACGDWGDCGNLTLKRTSSH